MYVVVIIHMLDIDNDYTHNPEQFMGFIDVSALRRHMGTNLL